MIVKSAHKASGFTLVELSLVLIIIGLLIGGVLKGQELVDNARVKAEIAQIESYKAMFATFQNQYGQLPGDMSNASTLGGGMGRIPGCDATTFCQSGNGDGIIGERISTQDIGQDSQAGRLGEPMETTMFWKHLVLANFTIGVAEDSVPVNVAWGETHPASPMRGGYHVFHSTTIGDWGTGTVLRLQNTTTGPITLGAGSNPISPHHAFMIDRKMDDGQPDTGSVAADFAGTGCDPAGTYANTAEKNCIMYFEME